MTLIDKKKTLVKYLNMKVIQEDWHGVSDAANDLREIEVALRFTTTETTPQISTANVMSERDVPLQAVPPVDADIIHHVNEVASLLKLSDEQLVDRMFPDFTQEAANAN